MKDIGQHAFEVTTSRPQDDAIARVTELLAGEGFGIVSEIDVKATLQKKLGLETPAYRILGACNPDFAHRAIQADPSVGVFLPCNVVVRDLGAHRAVSAMEPRIMAQVLDHPDLSEIAGEVSRRLRAALAKLD
jgi:uncharacterized protein (DUF302 family)